MGEFTTLSCLNDFFHIPPLRNDSVPKLFFIQIKVKRPEYCEINLDWGFYVHGGELNKVVIPQE